MFRQIPCGRWVKGRETLGGRRVSWYPVDIGQAHTRGSSTPLGTLLVGAEPSQKIDWALEEMKAPTTGQPAAFHNLQPKKGDRGRRLSRWCGHYLLMSPWTMEIPHLNMVCAKGESQYTQSLLQFTAGTPIVTKLGNNTAPTIQN